MQLRSSYKCPEVSWLQLLHRGKTTRIKAYMKVQMERILCMQEIYRIFLAYSSKRQLAPALFLPSYPHTVLSTVNVVVVVQVSLRGPLAISRNQTLRVPSRQAKSLEPIQLTPNLTFIGTEVGVRTTIRKNGGYEMGKERQLYLKFCD